MKQKCFKNNPITDDLCFVCSIQPFAEMKKIFVLIVFIIGFHLQIYSQQEIQTKDNNKINNYLPEAGDFSIGISIDPIVNFIGNSLNGYGTNGNKNTLGNIGGSVVNLNILPKPSVSLMGKYMLKNNFAVRINVGVVSSDSTKTAYVKSDLNSVTNPMSLENLVDKITTDNVGLMMTLGAEKRIGKDRIQGVFSVDLILGYQSLNIDYQYGNPLTNLNSKPTASSIMPGLDVAGYRIISKNYGNNYYFGGAFNVGLEYFIAPKIALGTEVSLLLYCKSSSSVSEEREGLNIYTNQLEKREFLISPGNRRIFINTDNLTSKLYLSFYF